MRVLSVVLTTALLALVPAAAQADPVPPEQRLAFYGGSVFNPEGFRAVGVELALVQVANPSGRSPAGTSLRVVTSSCGLPLTDRTTVLSEGAGAVGMVFTESGALEADGDSMNALNRNIGRSIEYSITVTQPGYDSYEAAGSIDVGEEMPTCGQIVADANDPAWGKRHGRARVGRSVYVEWLRDPRFRYVYTWRVGSKVVKTGDFSDGAYELRRLKPAWRGKRLTFTASSNDFGTDTVSKTYRYGRIR